jgi:SAM-dependent MidA family methyltransferase
MANKQKTTAIVVSRELLDAAIEQYRKTKKINPEERILIQGFIASLLAKYAAGTLIEKESKK